jgi:hypothetical protein
VHILTGEQYDPQGACMGPLSGIDIVSGGGNGDTCPPECLVATLADASAVYVSTTCPPVSPDYTTENQDQVHGPSDPCSGAFAAYEAGVTCSTEGGPPEAGSDAMADAGADAPTSGDDGSADSAVDAPQDAAGE